MTAPLGHLGERAVLEADEGIARVLPLQRGAERQPGRQNSRHVLHGMHGEVDRAGEQRLLDLLGKETLAALLG